MGVRVGVVVRVGVGVGSACLPACLLGGGGGGSAAAAAVCSLARSVAPAPTCHGLVVANVDGYI